MKKEKNNFARVIDYLRANGLIKNQKEMAERIGVTVTTITRNKHGNVGHTDEETLRRFYKHFGDVINIAYLRGDSDIMLVKDLHSEESGSLSMNLRTIDPVVAALLAEKDETIASLKRELASKDETIASKDAHIATLKQQVAAVCLQTTAEKGALEDGHSTSERAENGELS